MPKKQKMRPFERIFYITHPLLSEKSISLSLYLMYHFPFLVIIGQILGMPILHVLLFLNATNALFFPYMSMIHNVLSLPLSTSICFGSWPHSYCCLFTASNTSLVTALSISSCVSYQWFLEYHSSIPCFHSS